VRTSEQGLSSRKAIQLIASREIRVRMTSKAFIWTTIAFVAAVVAGGVLLNLIGSSQSAKQVGYTPAAAGITTSLAASAAASGLTVDTTEVPMQAAGEELLLSGEIEALVTAVSPTLTVVVNEKLDDSLAPLLTSLAQQGALTDAVSSLGGDAASISAQIAAATPAVTSLEPPTQVDGAQIVAGFVAGILLFIALMTAGQLVAQGVVEEKTSRVVELLLATVRPWQLMSGKVLGIGIVGLAQVVLVVTAGIGTALALGLLDSSTLNLGSTAAWAIVWFVIGFASYALVLAALGALVSRQEDVGSVIGPVTALMIIPYVIGVSIAPWAPDSPLVVWLSYIPFCSPLIMPIRIALGAVETWEILLSVGLSLAVIPLLVWLAGRVYSNAVLHSGGRVRLKDALRSD
jgi:ABC-2 type transport system permease protein